MSNRRKTKIERLQQTFRNDVTYRNVKAERKLNEMNTPLIKENQ